MTLCGRSLRTRSALDGGQPAVDYHDGVPAGQSAVQAGVAVVGHVDGAALAAEQPIQQRRQLGVVPTSYNVRSWSLVMTSMLARRL